MYQALYRKYRPKKFDDVIGQEVIIKTLENAVNNNKISHAYLFTGPRGTGKTSIAKIFAKMVNCEDIHGSSTCDKCVSCTLIDNNQSTDVIEIDAASNNGVDEIRNLKSKITLSPTNSKYKVYIIDEVHMLSTGAFNALLKTLEEPPSHAIFILATTEPQKLPSTILSRCQRYDFKRLSDDLIVERLKYICKNEKIKIDDDALYEIARLSEGGMRDSIGMLDQLSSYKDDNLNINDVHMVNGTLPQEEMSMFISELFNKNIDVVLNLIDEYNTRGKSIYKMIDEIIYFLRNLLIYDVSKEYLESKNINISIYSKVKLPSDLTKIYSLIDNLNKLKLDIRDDSNIKIMFEIELLKYLGVTHNNISQEIKPVENSNDDIFYETVDLERKNRRIENTLSRFNKKTLLNLKSNVDLLKKYSLDDKLGKYATLLLDGMIKAASDEYAIFVYASDSDEELFNTHLELLEKVYNKSMNSCYKLIAVTSDEWDTIKTEFNGKQKTYNYVKETISKKKESKKNELDNLFNDIVEYTEED